MSWFYMSVPARMMFFCFHLVFPKLGSLRPGNGDSWPEFSNFSWFAMLFSAGIGIGIRFFGVAEPVFYFDNSGAFGSPNNPHAGLASHSAMDMQRAINALRVAAVSTGDAALVFLVRDLCGLQYADDHHHAADGGCAPAVEVLTGPSQKYCWPTGAMTLTAFASLWLNAVFAP